MELAIPPRQSRSRGVHLRHARDGAPCPLPFARTVLVEALHGRPRRAECLCIEQHLPYPHEVPTMHEAQESDAGSLASAPSERQREI